MKLNNLCLFFLFLFLLPDASAAVKLPRILGNNMVLQRDAECKIWGWASKGEKVTVTFRELVKTAKAGSDGRWMVTFPPMHEGGPYQMKISGKNTITLENILIGDVWVCSGQSNMEMSVSVSNNAQEEIAAASYPQIRLFHVPHNIQFTPADDIGQGEWQECNPATFSNFSAVGYFFGRYIHQETGVPIGLLFTAWGGTVAETWISEESIRQMEDFRAQMDNLKNYNPEQEMAKRKEAFMTLLEKYGSKTPGIVDGKALWAAPDLDETGWGDMDLPRLWEQQPGLDGLDGVVWFRKVFELAPGIAASGITLELGPIDDSDVTWVNGKKVGDMNQSYNKPRIYKVPPEYLKPGKNVVTVRVEDTGGGGGIYGKPEELKITSGTYTASLAGTWKYRIDPEGLNLNVQNFVGPNSNPTLLYNGMIHPFLNFAVSGAIWYQGESNADRAYQYRTLFPLLINDWRKQWQNPDLAFFFVQLANYMAAREMPGESEWAELREAQSLTLSLPKTGMAVITDIGDANDIHPKNKQDVGKRLALSALKVSYGRDIVYSGPVYKDMAVQGSDVILSFSQTGSGLVAHDRYGYVKGFAVAGADRKFYWAEASVKNNKITVHSDMVAQPVAVRYAWADNPDDANLYNMEGLPASPFRTDEWPGITIKNK